MKKIIFFCLILYLQSIAMELLFAKNKNSYAFDKVFVKSSNIYYSIYSKNSKHIVPVQITFSGKDSMPILSPDKKIIAFLRESDFLIPERCSDFMDDDSVYAKQIWIYEIDKKKDRLLVANDFSCDEPEKKLLDFSHLQFSPDNQTLYFLTSGRTTSKALHAVSVDVNGEGQRYITSAKDFKVIMKGKYRGFLLVTQHRYFFDGDDSGSSYDWVGLVTAEGGEG